MRTSAAILFAAVSVSVFAADGEWPQWRGPNRDAKSTEKGLLQSWPEGGPKQVWLYENAGVGYSSPAVAGGKLFVMGTRDEKEQLIALDAQTGKELWVAPMGPVLTNNWGDGPRGTPSVDGNSVYAMSGTGELICASTSNGSVKWSVSMSDFEGGRPGWGYCESVLIDGKKLICTPGGAKGAVVALNKNSGELIWQSKDFTDGAQYSSVVAVNHNGKRQYIQLTQKHVVGLDAQNGDLLWKSDWHGKIAVVATPVFHEGHVYITSGYGAGCKLVRVGSNNEVEEVYDNKTMKNHHGGVILVDGHIYGYSDGAGWICQNLLSGEKVWNERRALGKGCVTYADGRLYCVSERDGAVALIEPSPAGWKEHGRFTLEPQSEIRKPSGKIWTHPVVAGGKLYLRDQDKLMCYDVKAK